MFFGSCETINLWFSFFLFCFLVGMFVDHCLKSFHRFVRPSRMSERRINEYIEGKYGKFGVDRCASNLFMAKA